LVPTVRREKSTRRNTNFLVADWLISDQSGSWKIALPIYRTAFLVFFYIVGPISSVMNHDPISS